MSKPISAEPLNITKYTSWGGAAGAAVLALYTALKATISGLDPTVALGLLLAGGLFLIAVAIASGADALARAYATAWTIADPNDSSKSIPASESLAQAIQKQNQQPRLVSLPPIHGAKVQEQPAKLLAMRLNPDGTTEFQVVNGDDKPEWVDPVAVSFT